MIQGETTLNEVADDDDNNNNDQESTTNVRTALSSPSNELVLYVAFFSFAGFVAAQFFAAVVANSQSMMADCQAMTVDAFTYLFNLCAERIKLRDRIEEGELHERRMKALWLELIPPLISVLALMAITITTLQDALVTLDKAEDEDDDDDVSAWLMILFSVLNLLVDIINMTCFARAKDDHHHSAFIMPIRMRSRLSTQDDGVNGATANNTNDPSSYQLLDGNDQQNNGAEEQSQYRTWGVLHLNMNMCSAWTHVFGDTLRSVSVFVAAAIYYIVPSISSTEADAGAAIAVSIIILLSILPLLHGLVATAGKIYKERQNHQRQQQSLQPPTTSTEPPTTFV